MAKRGQNVGEWTLRERLGKPGGNADVWIGVNPDGDEAAVKILRATNPNREPYRRFRDEVRVHTRLNGHPGVLPLLAADVPEDASEERPAWLATPIAVPIRDALSDDPTLEQVVEAIRALAVTLMDLAEKGISHRDIKPDNLYQHDERWVLGDLGLVSYPDKETLTEKGAKLGPAWFLAEEMLHDAEAAAGAPADVFSLAKTLWVLATGQTFPPQGEQRVDVPQNLLTAFIQHPRAHLLDDLIERATRRDPAARPTMADVASELAIWLEQPTVEIPVQDLSQVLQRIRSLGERERRREDRLDSIREEVTRLNSKASVSLQPVYDAIKGSGLREVGPGLNGVIIESAAVARLSSQEQRQVVYKDGFAITARSGPHSITSGIGLMATDEGRLFVCGGHVVGTEVRGAMPQNLVAAEHRSVWIPSVAADHAVEELAVHVRRTLREALERFALVLAGS